MTCCSEKLDVIAVVTADIRVSGVIETDPLDLVHLAEGDAWDQKGERSGNDQPPVPQWLAKVLII